MIKSIILTSIMAVVILAGTFLPCYSQSEVTRVAHPGGLTVLRVENPIVRTWRDTSDVLHFWQLPAGRFQLLTGVTPPTGGNPSVTGDEDRIIASLTSSIDDPNDLPYQVFSSKMTLAVGGTNETGNYFDIHALGAAADEVSGTDAMWNYWPTSMSAGSRDIVGTARVPLDDEDPNLALEFVDIQHHFTLIGDALKVEYIVTNTSTRTLPIGIRIFVDGTFGAGTQLDGSSVFLPNGQVVTSEKVIPDATTSVIPNSWVALDNPDNPLVMLRGTLGGTDITDPGIANEAGGKPDLVGWGLSRNMGSDAQWNFVPNSVIGLDGEDWGYFVRWNEKDLAPGRSRRYVTYYGVGASSSDYDPSYAFMAYAPVSLEIRQGDDVGTPEVEEYYLTDGQGSNPFTVSAFADNFYPSPLLDASVRISLPEGLELDPATQARTKSLGTIKRNELKSVSWTVRPTTVRPGVSTITFTGPLGKTVQRKINIPSIPVLTPLPSENGLEMISIPYTFDDTDAENVFQSLGNLNIGGAASLIRWNPLEQAYSYFPDPFITNVEPGIGFWLLNRNRFSVVLPSDAEALPTDTAYSINLSRGWNQIGNPFTSPVYLSDIKILDPLGIERTMSEAVSRGLLLSSLYQYDPSTVEYIWETELSSVRLDPYVGYWIYCFEDISLQVPAPTPVVPFAVKSATSVTTASDGWKVGFTVSGAGRVRTERVIGVSDTASDNIDAKDVLAPPAAISSGTVLTAEWINDSASMMQDIKKSGVNNTWTMKVTTNAVNEPITITWPDLSNLPANVNAILIDKKTGEKRYLRTCSGYTFTCNEGQTQRDFEISISPRSSAVAMVTSASISSSAGSQTIVYALSNDAEVSIEVCNISGVPVRQIVSSKLSTSGMHTVAWDGRSGTGTMVPTGRYLCRITARSAQTGEQHSVVRSFNVTR